MNNIFKLIIIFALFLSKATAQPTDSITSNLINNTTTANTVTSTWQNAGTINQPITCWAPGDPGYCGPQPYVNAWGSPNTVNFSYGFTELYQVVNVSKALPNLGSGLVTTGFIFNWRSKNGNYWDDGRQDELKAYVQGYTKSGKWIENFNYDLNFVHNWTDFTWNQNWSKIRRPDDLANVVFGFAGKDNNFWTGPYGPEITNISFSLKYKPDPCVKNPLYSPECPKFTDELSKITATPTTNTATSSNTIDYQPPKSENDINHKKDNNFDMGEKEDGVFRFEEERLAEPTHLRLDNLEFALNKIFDTQIKQEEQSIEIANNAVAKTEQQTKDIVRNAEQRVREVVDQQFKDIESVKPEHVTEQSKQNTTGLESIFKGPETNSSVTQFSLPGNQNTSVVTILQDNRSTTNQQREQQNTAIRPQQNIQQLNNRQETNFTFELGRDSVRQSESVFGTVNSRQSLPSVAIYAPLQNQMSTTQNTQPIVNNVEVVVQPVFILPRAESQINTTPTVSNTNTTVTQQLFQPTTPSQNIEIPTLANNFLTNRADPINEILESKNNIKVENKVEEKTQTLKPNVQDNEVAGGVAIQNIATIPVGFNQYTNFILRDVAFYAPKEIYRGQRTVDNARALRNLSSDRLHQDMIDLQYRR
jgi:vacuolar-type H+-ATPase subunit H